MSDATIGRAGVTVPAKSRPAAIRKGPLFVYLDLAVAVGAAWYFYQCWTVGRFIESTDDAYVGGKITVIAPKVAGLIAQVEVTDNQTVHAGDLLVKLDDRDYRATLDKTTAAVAGQTAALANLEATRGMQQAMIEQAAAETAAAAVPPTRLRSICLGAALSAG
jgi:membrane fusion protein, multidrug efflux system